MGAIALGSGVGRRQRPLAVPLEQGRTAPAYYGGVSFHGAPVDRRQPVRFARAAVGVAMKRVAGAEVAIGQPPSDADLLHAIKTRTTSLDPKRFVD